MRKLSTAIAATFFAITVTVTVTAALPTHAAEAGGHCGIPSVPEAWSPEGRAPYTPPPVPEAWSPEGQKTSTCT
jgi:hypothetical protein